MLTWSSRWVHSAHCDVDFSLRVFSNRSFIVIPLGTRFFASDQTGPGANPAICTMRTGSLSRE